MAGLNHQIHGELKQRRTFPHRLNKDLPKKRLRGEAKLRPAGAAREALTPRRGKPKPAPT